MILLLLGILLVVFIVFRKNKDNLEIVEKLIVPASLFLIIGGVFTILWLFSLEINKWTTITDTKIYKPKLIGMNINSHLIYSSDSTKWIEWFKKDKDWELGYIFIKYNPKDDIEIKLVLTWNILEDNKIPYGIERRIVSCHDADIIYQLMTFKWTKICKTKREFILNKKYFINKK